MKAKFLTLIAAAAMTLSASAQRLTFNGVFAPSEGYVNPTEADFRHEVCLNGRWDFQPVSLPDGWQYGQGQAPALPLPTADDWDAVKIKIPSPWNVNDFAYRDLEGPDHRNYPSYPQAWEQVKMAWMRRTVEVPADWTDACLRLHFEAVAGYAEVYVDGRKVGERSAGGRLQGKNFDLFLPFDIDITDCVQAGQTFELMVGVRAASLFDDNSTVGRRTLPAGSMWGIHIAGIWQDVYLLAVPRVNVADVFVKPLVSQNKLQLEVTVANTTDRRATVTLGGTVREWLDEANQNNVLLAPVPRWSIAADAALKVPATKVTLDAHSHTSVTVDIPVPSGALKYWTPETPSLYALLLTLTGSNVNDLKYERFGWREWTFNGTQQCLNGQPYPLRSDSWHFMGIPQMTRRYAWAWYRAIKDMNGNAVRLHAQVYPRFYHDVADEMGICILDETSNWASDGGPKLDSDLFWEASRQHLRRFVLRDRNHPSVFGWSISNENKPVILYVFQRPDLMPLQERAWEEWRDIVRATDPTRPWISSDGEDDGDGRLPATVGHYGDQEAMRRWQQIGKPWGIGETGMCYYGTPLQVARIGGQRAYESAEGRMEGLATECYHLIKDMRAMGASYSTVFNMVWYALQPLPLGKRDVTVAPTMADGVFFPDYVEGQPGVQPERIGPYSTTLNPGYDPALPLYRPWPLFGALRAANAESVAAWSPWAEVDTMQYRASGQWGGAEPYAAVRFIGSAESPLKQLLDAQGVIFADKTPKRGRTLYIVDAADPQNRFPQPKKSDQADIWLWGLTSETAPNFAQYLSLPLQFDTLCRSSFLPENRSWMRGLQNADFYFCEDQQHDAARYTLRGPFVDEGEVLLRACRTDWRRWNLRPEELKTAALLRSELESTEALPVFVRCGNVIVSTLTDFASSEHGFSTLSAILRNAGITQRTSPFGGEAGRGLGLERDSTNLFLDPSVDTSKKTSDADVSQADAVAPPVRIACLGASITEGYGTTEPWSQNAYPGRLGVLLGPGYEVMNFGRGGCTMIKKGEMPYWNYEQLQQALESHPDIVFIDLGGNDAKLVHRVHKADFVADACELVSLMQQLPTHPRVILMTAIPGFTADSTQIWDEAIVRDINPRIIEAGRRAGVEVLDMHPLFEGRPDLLPDDIHPNDEGAAMMAQKMAWYLRTYPRKPADGPTIDGIPAQD